jgi:hypothetical protein
MSMSADHNLMAEMSADDVAGMVMDDMPCCPHERPAMPDCSKACPLMALCPAEVVPDLPMSVGPSVPAPVALGVAWDGDAAFASPAQAPPSEPPGA